MEDYPRNLAEFETRFAGEQACREYLCQLRWPEGFRCPRCGHAKAWAVRTVLLECAGCGHQASATAGTIFQDTRKPLQSWFRAMWWLTSQKNGASALGLQRVLGLGSYKTAWTWLHKLRRAMVRPGRDRLRGRVEVDETYLGALEEGVRGRQTDAKALIVVAAEEDGAGIGRVRMRTIPNASGDSLMAFVGESIEPGSVVHTDGWLGYEAARRRRLSPRGELPGGATGARLGTAPPGALRGVVSEALDTGHASRSGQPRASRLLPRRIHLPLQPPQVRKSRQAVLPPGSAGRRRGTGALQIAGRRHRDTRSDRPQHVVAISSYLSQVNTHLNLMYELQTIQRPSASLLIGARAR